MCVAIPMKLAEKKDVVGFVEMEGLRQEVNLQLLDDAEVGDYVIVHAGFAIERLDESEAMETLELMREAGILKSP
jgi:hydrogenase expression/formation protein HypC